MDKDEFLQKYKRRTNKHTREDIVYNEFVRYCREYNIDEDNISTEDLTELAEEVARNGL